MWRRLLDDDSGQATTEYILLLAIIMGVLITVKQQIGPILDRVVEARIDAVERQLTGSFHNVRVN